MTRNSSTPRFKARPPTWGPNAVRGPAIRRLVIMVGLSALVAIIIVLIQAVGADFTGLDFSLPPPGATGTTSDSTGIKTGQQAIAEENARRQLQGLSPLPYVDYRSGSPGNRPTTYPIATGSGNQPGGNQGTGFIICVPVSLKFEGVTHAYAQSLGVASCPPGTELAAGPSGGSSSSLAELPKPKLDCFLKNSGGCTDLGQFLGHVATIMIGIAATLFFFMMLWGGIRYLTSAGDQSATTAAKQTLLGASIGLVVVIGSYAIIRLILETLGAK